MPDNETFNKVNALCKGKGVRLFVDEMYRNLEMVRHAYKPMEPKRRTVFYKFVLGSVQAKITAFSFFILLFGEVHTQY